MTNLFAHLLTKKALQNSAFLISFEFDDYLPSAVPIVANFVIRLVVIDGIAASKATDIAAAIRPYSIAVAPDSSLRNLFI